MLCQDRKVLQSMITAQQVQWQIKRVYTCTNAMTQGSYQCIDFANGLIIIFKEKIPENDISRWSN